MPSRLKPLPELKPCPFCGCKWIVTVSTLFAPKWYLMRCRVLTCAAEGPRRKAERGAINAWNRREGEGI